MSQLKLFNTIGKKNGIYQLDITNFKSTKSEKTRPFLRYPGSKYNACKYISPFWENICFDEYREPFLGSGAVFFKMKKCKVNILNDLDKELINCYEVLKDKKFLKQFLEKEITTCLKLKI
mgnify:CR=1 FL=1